MSDAITVSGLDVRFGASHVVKDVRFTVGEGESYGIVGGIGFGQIHHPARAFRAEP